VASWLAIDRLGGVVVPVLPGKEPKVFAEVASDCGARVAIIDASFAEGLGQVHRNIPALAVVLYAGPENPAAPGSWTGRFEPLDAHRPDVGDVPRPIRGPGDVAALIYGDAGRNTGRGCMVTQGQLVHGSDQTLDLTGRAEDELHWSAEPVLTMAAMVTTVLPTMGLASAASIAPVGDVRDFWAEIDRTGARIASLSPSAMTKVGLSTASPEQQRCRGQLRVVLGASPEPEMQDLWSARFGVEIPGIASYWRPEAGLLTAVVCGEYAAPGSAGRRQAAFDTRIFDGDDDEQEPGSVGEIVCRPRKPHVMFAGYWNRPEATVIATRNMWFHTGDSGRFDADGFLHVVEDESAAVDKRPLASVRYM
jgi:crotonobetaine/carnitine-CoA ligase